MTIQIPLRRGGFALIDDADEILVREYSWWSIVSPSPNRPSVYARGSTPGKEFNPLMHKLLTGWDLVDHVNGNGLDNRRNNLRRATRSQNGGNRRKAIATRSRFKGVTPYAGTRWRAYITVERRREHLGCFNSEISAAIAYDLAARAYFGEFAALNFPGPGERGALVDMVA